MQFVGALDRLGVLFRRPPRGVELAEEACVLERDRRMVGEGSQ
jgi:hypothetical protein